MAHSNGGFTLLEVLAVMVLVAIFTVIAVVQHSTSDATLTAQTEVLKSHLRYAQMRSMNTDTAWGIAYRHNSASIADCHYFLFFDDTGNIKPLPGETGDRVYIGEMDITIGAAAGAGSPSNQDFEVAFDSWGRPSSTTLPGTGSYTVELSQPGHDSRQFVITRNTGFID